MRHVPTGSLFVISCLVACGGAVDMDSPDATPGIDAATDAAPGRVALAVTRNGDGNGLVASAPAGIDCGATCSAMFDTGATVVLTATPDSGHSFPGLERRLRRHRHLHGGARRGHQRGRHLPPRVPGRADHRRHRRRRPDQRAR